MIMMKLKNRHIFNIGMQLIYMVDGWAMLQKLQLIYFKRIKDTSQFNEDFMKNCNEEIDEGYFFKVKV